ncbi:hypothetical protein [Streptomyces chartreusis]|uniref:hypothetical protein n=1 Tax=Streptomyces chartreusis TaxID=1969 RepID=UPI0033E78ED3|nr:hypothetical protein OG938_43820 [Streptomyces chartreusis]
MEPAFELSFWCGTCPLLFRRLETANQTLSLESVQERLTGALSDPDDEGVREAFGALLPENQYVPMLLRVEPRLVVPGKDGDYFSGEQVATWGLDHQGACGGVHRTLEPGNGPSAGSGLDTGRL